MKLKIRKHTFFIQLFFLVILSYITLVFYYFENYSGISFTILILYIYIFTIKLHNSLSKNITLIAFLICFFTFLLTRIFIPIFRDTSDLVIDIGGGRIFNSEIQSFINLSIYTALLSIYVGYEIIYKQNKFDNKSSQNHFFNKKSIIRVRKFSRATCMILSVFAAVNIFDQIRFVINHGYLDYYLNYTCSIPYIIVFLATFFEYFFVFYIATMPPKKECIPVITLYLIINILSMGTGQRGGAILAIMFVITYFFLRNNLNSGQKQWITKRGIMLLALSVPVLISFLFLFAYIRTDKDTEKFDNKNLALSFFYQQGVTINVIGFVKDYEKKLPEGKFYSIGKIVDFANHNIISQLILGTSNTKPQSLEHALQDHTLHATLTYFESPNLYFSGGGYGGCYIADLWADWGFFGIIVGNLIFGICLAKIRIWCNKSFWKASVGLLMYTCILFAPRSNFIDFIYVFIPFSASICYLIIYIVAKSKSSNNNTNNTNALQIR